MLARSVSCPSRTGDLECPSAGGAGGGYCWHGQRTGADPGRAPAGRPSLFRLCVAGRPAGAGRLGAGDGLDRWAAAGRGRADDVVGVGRPGSAGPGCSGCSTRPRRSSQPCRRPGCSWSMSWRWVIGPWPSASVRSARPSAVCSGGWRWLGRPGARCGGRRPQAACRLVGSAPVGHGELVEGRVEQLELPDPADPLADLHGRYRTVGELEDHS